MTHSHTGHIYSKPGDYTIEIDPECIPTGLETEFEVLNNIQPDKIVVKLHQTFPKSQISNTYMISNSFDTDIFVQHDSSGLSEFYATSAFNGKSIECSLYGTDYKIELSSILCSASKMQSYFTDTLELDSISDLTCVSQQFIKSIYIPDYVSELPDGFLSNAVNLHEIYFNVDKTQSKLSSIGKNAFYRSFKLKNLSFPDSMLSIGQNAFHDCINLRAIYSGKNYISFDKESTFNLAKEDELYVKQDYCNAPRIEESQNGSLMLGSNSTVHNHNYVYDGEYHIHKTVLHPYVSRTITRKRKKRVGKLYRFPIFHEIYKYIEQKIEDYIVNPVVEGVAAGYNWVTDLFSQPMLMASSSSNELTTRLSFLGYLKLFFADDVNLKVKGMTQAQKNDAMIQCVKDMLAAASKYALQSVDSIADGTSDISASLVEFEDYSADNELQLSTMNIQLNDYTYISDSECGITVSSDESLEEYCRMHTANEICMKKQAESILLSNDMANECAIAVEMLENTCLKDYLTDDLYNAIVENIKQRDSQNSMFGIPARVEDIDGIGTAIVVTARVAIDAASLATDSSGGLIPVLMLLGSIEWYRYVPVGYASVGLYFSYDAYEHNIERCYAPTSEEYICDKPIRCVDRGFKNIEEKVIGLHMEEGEDEKFEIVQGNTFIQLAIDAGLFVANDLNDTTEQLVEIAKWNAFRKAESQYCAAITRIEHMPTPCPT